VGLVTDCQQRPRPPRVQRHGTQYVCDRPGRFHHLSSRRSRTSCSVRDLLP